MNESKELLEATIKGLEEKLESVKSDLGMKVRELADVNKPEMTDVMFDEITELVDDAINGVTINEEDIEFSPEFDYDNKVCLTDISLQNSDRFAEKVMCAIDEHYKIVDTQVTNATHVEKVI